MKIVSNITIHASVDEVFRMFSDLNTVENSVDGIKNIEVLEKSPQMEVGTKWSETRMMFGKEAKETMWVTALTPSKNYVVEAESHGTKYRSEYRFEETPEGTKVTMEFVGTPASIGAKIMNLMVFLFKNSMKKMLTQDMTDLKRVIEQGSGSRM